MNTTIPTCLCISGDAAIARHASQDGWPIAHRIDAGSDSGRLFVCMAGHHDTLIWQDETWAICLPLPKTDTPPEPSADQETPDAEPADPTGHGPVTAAATGPTAEAISGQDAPRRKGRAMLISEFRRQAAADLYAHHHVHVKEQ